MSKERNRGGGKGRGASGAGKGRSARVAGRNLTTRVRTAKGRKTSSTRWLQRQLNDPYVAEAKRLGYRSRAAFKLIELDQQFKFLKPGGRIVDLGAAPGGWTWALARLGAEVIAVDKAEMDPAVAALSNVSVRTESAFGLEPADLGPVDWLFSDVICYPKRLLELVLRWRDERMAGRFVCTIKFQGDEEHEAARGFAAIPGARVVHLHHNKHELTFLLDAR